MNKAPRFVAPDMEGVYHIVSRSVLDGFVMGNREKDYLLSLTKWVSSVFLVEVLGFCIMDNHFHLLVRTKNIQNYTVTDIKERIRLHCLYTGKRFNKVGINNMIKRLGKLDEYVKQIKVKFSQYYNDLHVRKGFFWNGKFKSVLVEEGHTLLTCLAYIDLNPVRAKIVEKPEDYRWSSLWHHIKYQNEDNFLSTNFGLDDYAVMSYREKVTNYLRFLYKSGELNYDDERFESVSNDNITKKGKKRRTTADILRKGTRYFTDSAIIGSREFIKECCNNFSDHFKNKDRTPRMIPGCKGIYSLKYLPKE